jgi:hypothetical protein
MADTIYTIYTREHVDWKIESRKELKEGKRKPYKVLL